MNKWETAVMPANADYNKRTNKQISQGIDYKVYVFSYGWRLAFAGFAFGFSLLSTIIFIDTRLSCYVGSLRCYPYTTGERVLAPLIFGLLFGAPVLFFAIKNRRRQYDYWAEKTVERENEQAIAKPSVKTEVRPFERVQNNNGTSNQYRIGSHSFDMTLLQQWASTVLSRVDSEGNPDYRIVRDQIPPKLFPGDIKKQWTDLSIQRELVKLGWVQWRYGREGSNEAIDLTAVGIDRFEEFANSPTP